MRGDSPGLKMTAPPLVTVLIDTYNYGRYVEAAVRSVLEQKFPSGRREILVVDDGSTDDTPERLQKFGDAIRYLRKPNGRQASALNYGFERARGDIVALLDADDVWLPGKLERVVRAFEDNPDAGLVYHRYWEVDTASGGRRESGLSLVSGLVPTERKKLLSYHIYPTSALAFRRDLLTSILPIPIELTFQADAYLAALVVFVAPVLGLPDFLADYRIHGQNLFHGHAPALSRERLLRRIKTRQALLDGIRDWLRNQGHNLESGNAKAYLKQWKLAQARDQFEIEPPSRWQLFRHRLDDARTYAELRSSRHRLLTYATAFGSLLFGYRTTRAVKEMRAMDRDARPAIRVHKSA
jgi:glycosyltransferase involved in cell wall biosynthesis